MKGKKTIFKKVKRNDPYIIIDKTIFCNNKISWKAKGILTYLVGLPDDWEVSIKALTNKSPSGSTLVSNAVNELINYNYIKRTTIRDKKKKIVKWIYLVSEVPFNLIDNKPTLRKPKSRKPRSRKARSRKATFRKSPVTKYIYNQVNNNIKEKTSKKKKDLIISEYENIPEVIKLPELAKIVFSFINYQRKKFGKAVNCDKSVIVNSIDALDKLIRLDDFNINEIKHTLNFAVADDFWCDKVLSLAGIRNKKNGKTSKFQKLYVRAGSKLRKDKMKKDDEDKQNKISNQLGI